MFLLRMLLNNQYMKKILSILVLLPLILTTNAATKYSELPKCFEYLDSKNYEYAYLCFERVSYYTVDLSTKDKEFSDKWLFFSYHWWAVELFEKKEYESALKFFNKALGTAYSDDLKKTIEEKVQLLKWLIKTEENKKNPFSNDPLSYLQYYLKALNVPSAWAKVTNNKTVTVAVIDDGLNINHPDLLNSVWVDPNAKYGSSKIINFVDDKLLDNMPAGEHGTMVAGIIWASTNNKEGIAGIARNVKIMPLRVFNLEGGAKENDIIKALNYAVDNGANIINLSLGQSQFIFSNKYDSVIKKAYDKWVVVVIAAWNGDILAAKENGVNLTNNPISPVCNNGGQYNKYSIGVYASDENGYRTLWTNYGDCAPFMAPWENIVSTSIPVFNTTYGTNYNSSNGTSFSAPMIAGIVALWYNQYGYVKPSIVYESLLESTVQNSVGNYVVDAAKYLTILWNKISTIQFDQEKNNQKQNITEVLKSVESVGDTLAGLGIVTKKNSEQEYRLNDPVLRQEVIGMAVKILGLMPSDNYSCQNYFVDVSSKKPNNWICKSLELAADNDLVSRKNTQFRPSAKITRAEALSILIKAAWMKTENAALVSSYSDVTVEWQIQVTNVASETGIIDLVDKFRPNAFATRWEIFEMARRILLNK